MESLKNVLNVVIKYYCVSLCVVNLFVIFRTSSTGLDFRVSKSTHLKYIKDLSVVLLFWLKFQGA